VRQSGGGPILTGEQNAPVEELKMGNGVVTFGRAAWVNVRVKGWFISELQAKITPTDDGYVLSNVGRRNKTFVNGEPIIEHELRNGDLIRVGKTVFRFIAGICMTWAFFSDVHGNIEALQAVAADIKTHGVDRALFLGDAIGYGASPNECVELISEITEFQLIGNHDEAALASSTPFDFNRHARAAVDWTREALTKESRRTMENWLLETQWEGLRFAHSSPDRPGRWDYVLDPNDAEDAFHAFGEQTCFIGHTHQPIIFKKIGDSLPVGTIREECELDDSTRYLINVGSVGQPRDGDPRACYALFDPETSRVMYRRLEYDVNQAQTRIRKATLPTALADRLGIGR
jgi:diadenosine tetraphosphatase ApaH/serine/threonine PP2A family protein phosphatase